ncbi:hypothetical protein F4780DRAFT_185272 [Xylariomycetidae sp. FL0641]|nr:hypothetical protein F4780DRAFT_185272 [Xylariomycetidae sp. FL0641]
MSRSRKASVFVSRAVAQLSGTSRRVDGNGSNDRVLRLLLRSSFRWQGGQRHKRILGKNTGKTAWMGLCCVSRLRPGPLEQPLAAKFTRPSRAGRVAGRRAGGQAGKLAWPWEATAFGSNHKWPQRTQLVAVSPSSHFSCHGFPVSRPDSPDDNSICEHPKLCQSVFCMCCRCKCKCNNTLNSRKPKSNHVLSTDVHYHRIISSSYPLHPLSWEKASHKSQEA